MIASQTEASTRSDSTRIATRCGPPLAGAASLEQPGTHSATATRAHDGAAHGLGAHLGQAPRAVALEAREEVGGHGQAQHDVAEEGKSLVGLRRGARPTRRG